MKCFSYDKMIVTTPHKNFFRFFKSFVYKVSTFDLENLSAICSNLKITTNFIYGCNVSNEQLVTK